MAMFVVVFGMVMLGSSCARAEIPEHRVHDLPGLEKAAYSGRQWSGYIAVDVPSSSSSSAVYKVHMHYWLFESELGLEQAPTATWYNGGPGSSSLIGLFTENGPFQFSDQSFLTESYNKTGIPSVFINQHSWHSKANMLYVEHPAPTGFSYCENDRCPHWNDTLQAVVNYKFLVSFFSLYPEVSSNEFFMTGESYAGVLIPTTALEILKHTNQTNKNNPPWSLKGFALGNACPGNRVYTCTPYSGWLGVQVAVDFRFGHGMISPSTYDRINDACKHDWDRFDPALNESCLELIGSDPARPVMQEAGDTYQMGGGYYLYDHCGGDLFTNSEEIRIDDQTGLPKTTITTTQKTTTSASQAPSTTSTYNKPDPDNDNSVYKCGQERASRLWLNKKEVQEAIHVKNLKFSYTRMAGFEYDYTQHSLLDEYASTLFGRFRIYQYSGDADPCVPHVGTRKWIDSLNLPVKVPWHPWSVGGRVGGYATLYSPDPNRHSGVENFTFVTVRDAGHMVPRNKPKQALHIFESFLNNDVL